MKIKIFLSTILLFSLLNIVQAQDEKTVHFGFNISPTLNKQIFDTPDDQFSNILLGYDVGLNIFYDISKRFEFKSGVHYRVNHFNLLDYTPVFGCDIDPFGGVDAQNSWIESKYTILYIGIPLELRYKIRGLENHLYGKLGFEPLLKVATASQSKIVECGINEYEIESAIFKTPNILLYTVKLGIGFEFKITSSINFYIEPEVSYSINKIFEQVNNSNNSRILRFGLILGTRI